MEGWTEDVPGFLHPLAAGLIRCDGASVGWFGALHPDFLTAEDIQGEVMAFELDASRLLALRADLPTMKPIARYPASQRDFALVVDADLPFAAVEGALESFVDRRLVEHSLFDLYSGEQLAATKKSLAIKVTFQDPRKTLSDKAIMQLQERLVAHLKTVLGAELR
jgi:phenylalanyl-tRNA synthetase beta chain